MMDHDSKSGKSYRGYLTQKSGHYSGSKSQGSSLQLQDMDILLHQQPYEQVRQEYVEEPSRRNSLFIEYKNTSEVERSAAELAMRDKIIKMVVSFVSLSISTFMFKQVFVNYRHTIFEDIYGRGIVFFICSLMHYLVQKGPISLFDLKLQLRTTFLFRVLFISTAYVFLYLAILNTSSFVYVALIISMLPPISKVVQRQAMVDRNFSCLDAISLIISIVGLVLLYRGNHLFSVNFTQNYNNKYAYIFGVIAVVCWSVANFLLHKQQVHIHHSIDTLFVSLFMALIIPAALLIYFSVNPTKLAYDMVQFLYFLASGVLTWVFHSCYTQVIAQDLKNSYLGIIYIYLVIAFFVDSIFYEEVLTMPQLIAFILIVIPNGMLIMLRALGLIRA